MLYIIYQILHMYILYIIRIYYKNVLLIKHISLIYIYIYIYKCYIFNIYHMYYIQGV